MSAGPAPPNPGTPRGSTKGPNPSLLGRYGTRILAGGILLGVAYTYAVAKPPAPAGTVSANPMRTTGVKNIEGAYKSGGATSTHTKAYGGTTQGNKSDENLREGGATGKPQGLQDEHHGSSQKPAQPSKTTEMWNDMNMGSGKGK